MALSKLDSTSLGTLSGNIVFADGQGIDFSATSDSTGVSSELLYDYEYGTFTPTVSAGTVTTANGYYIKIGNLVKVGISLITFSDTTSTTQVQVNNLPFTPATPSPNAAGGAVFSGNCNPAPNGTYVSTNLHFYASNTGSNYAAIKHNNLVSTARFFCEATYYTTS